MTGASITFSGFIGAIFLVVQAMALVLCYSMACKYNSKFLLFIAVLISGFTVGMRFNYGLDTYNYAQWVIKLGSQNSLLSAFLWSDHEKSFIILCYFTYKIFGTYRVLFLIYGVLTSFFVLVGIWNFKDKINIIPAVMYYIVFWQWGNMCNIMRQSLAVSIVFFGIKYIYEEKYLKYFITILIASLFHFSAITAIIMIFYGLPNSKIGKALRSMNILSIGLLVVGPPILIKVMTMISSRYSYSITTKIGAGFIVNLVILWITLKYTARQKERYVNSEIELDNNDYKFTYMIRHLVILATIFVISDYTIGEGARFREYYNTIYILTMGFCSQEYSIARICRTKSINYGAAISYAYPLLYFVLLCKSIVGSGGIAFAASLMS
ncbi:MAG: EpsG family protein [Faecalibacterium sp.]